MPGMLLFYVDCADMFFFVIGKAFILTNLFIHMNT